MCACVCVFVCVWGAYDHKRVFVPVPTYQFLRLQVLSRVPVQVCECIVLMFLAGNKFMPYFEVNSLICLHNTRNKEDLRCSGSKYEIAKCIRKTWLT